jgi:hypothetical protein
MHAASYGSGRNPNIGYKVNYGSHGIDTVQQQLISTSWENLECNLRKSISWRYNANTSIGICNFHLLQGKYCHICCIVYIKRAQPESVVRRRSNLQPFQTIQIFVHHGTFSEIKSTIFRCFCFVCSCLELICSGFQMFLFHGVCSCLGLVRFDQPFRLLKRGYWKSITTA